MQDCGSEAYIRKKAEDFIEQAKEILYQFPDNKYRSLLLELTSFIVGRDK
jgi:geranylgeranyl pyrophosphate synthase